MYCWSLHELESFVLTKSAYSELIRPEPELGQHSVIAPSPSPIAPFPIVPSPSVIAPFPIVPSPIAPSAIVHSPIAPSPQKKINLSSLEIAKPCQDILFWSLFLGHYGRNEYDRVGGKVETEEKVKIAEHFFKSGGSVKLEIKMTKTNCKKITEDILTQPKTLLSSLYAYNIYYDCNIYLVNLEKKTYLKYAHEIPKDETIVLYKRGGNAKYYIDTTEKLYTLEYIRNHFHCLWNQDKSLKASTHYKYADLELIASKVGISMTNDKKLSKSELYENLLLYCAWN